MEAVFRASKQLFMAAAKSHAAPAKKISSKMPKAHAEPKTDIKPKRPATGFLKPLPVSSELAKFCGASEIARASAVKKLWDYIKQNNLQNPSNKKEIICDDKLKTLFAGRDTVGFLEIAKLLSPHFTATK